MHNSVVGHIGVNRTYKTLKLRGHNWKGMREDQNEFHHGPLSSSGNSMAERRLKEVGAHLRALVYEYRIKSEWSHYLPLV